MIVDTTQTPVKEIQRLNMKERIRGAAQAEDGSLWVIEDGASQPVKNDSTLIRFLKIWG